jgi:hypothetical protein
MSFEPGARQSAKVVTRSPHCDRHRQLVEPNFKRLFNGEQVLSGRSLRPFDGYYGRDQRVTGHTV